MGIKFLILQMIPWCFPMMGNASTTACHHPDTPIVPSSPAISPTGSSGKAPTSVKLIRTDGKVEVYYRPVSASELMSGHPMHLVCRSDAFTIGQRIPALSEEEELQPGHAYFLLPVHYFQSILSFVTIASSFARAAAAASPASALSQRPFDVHRTPDGALQIRVSDEFIERMEEAQDGVGGGGAGGDGGDGGRVCTTAALEKDYRQLVVGSRARHWKPKLETIKESEKGGRSLVAVAGAATAFGDITGIRKKAHRGGDHHQDQQQKQQRQKQQQQQQQQQQQKEQKLKLSAISQLLNSPSPHKSKGKKVIACDLYIAKS